MRNRKGMDIEGKEQGEELGGVEGGETLIGVYYVRENSIFNKGGVVPFNAVPKLQIRKEN